jgi:hypothetical protein
MRTAKFITLANSGVTTLFVGGFFFKDTIEKWSGNDHTVDWVHNSTMQCKRDLTAII